MHPLDIRAHLRKQPFQSIRFYLSDGSSCDVHHPELVVVTRTEVVIALPGGDSELPERAIYCDPIHITRIEPISRPPRRARKRTRKRR